MSAPTAVAVVIPARDEQELLSGCLESVGGAVRRLASAHPRIRCQIFVVLDSCRDASAEIVADYPGVRAVVGQMGCVGAARAVGVEAAAAWNPALAANRLWLANTDADGTVPRSWLVSQVAYARRGYDLVVGMVEPSPGDLTVDELSTWRARHQVSDGHDHVYGANLGFSLPAYRAVGGYRPLPVHEDVELVSAMRKAGATSIAPAQPRVVTSGRRIARAPQGFATYLTTLGS